MSDHPSIDVAETPAVERPRAASYRVLFDDQCEICQACVSWLKALDREEKTACVSISAEDLLEVDSRLGIDDCLRQLHVVTPENEILVGWEAVACLARLFPSTWVVGKLG
jgi:predicted DCC family thiol-disulfide oxidoreductase YuxK